MTAAEKSSAVPVAQFKLVNDNVLDNKVEDTSMAKFGYNTVDNLYMESKAYQRYIEPLEEDLNQQVEYDMDEQDKIWLDDLNKFRNSIQIGNISYEMFEIIVDRLEKEYLDLQKKLPQKTPKDAFSEDSTCLICNDSECDNSNAIVFCDGCNLAVHQDCYGIPYIPEGQWLCRKCTVSPENPVSCVLCPNEGGAFKQTNSGAWAHVLCANWIPETGLSNPVYQEPVEGVDRIPKSRWKLICYICKQKTGACIQCDDRSCFVAMHTTCAQKFGLLCKTRNIIQGDQLEEAVVMRALCHRHRPKTVKSAPLFDIDKDASIIPSLGAASTKAARAHSHNFNPGPPLVPQYMVDRIFNHIDSIDLEYKMEVVHEVTKYWALKRERRRGAGLIRRLHLEPWSATVNSQHSEADKRQKLEYLAAIRDDLERAKKLADLVIEREAAKQNQVNHLVETIFHFLFPYDKPLRLMFEKIVALDETELFAEPVPLEEAPNYLDIIKTPMDWSTIYSRIDKRVYRSKSDFVKDVITVYHNAMHYNQEGSAIYIETEAQKKQCEEILAQSLQGVESFEADQAMMKMLSEEQGIEKLFDTSLYIEASPEPDTQHNEAAHNAANSRKSKKSKRKRKEYVPEVQKAQKMERLAKQRAEADLELQRMVEAGLMSSRSMRSQSVSSPQEKNKGDVNAAVRAKPRTSVSTSTPKSVPHKLRQQAVAVDLGTRSVRRGTSNTPSKLSNEVGVGQGQQYDEEPRKTELHGVKRRSNEQANESPSVSNKRMRPETRTRSSRRSMAAEEGVQVAEASQQEDEAATPQDAHPQPSVEAQKGAEEKKETVTESVTKSPTNSPPKTRSKDASKSKSGIEKNVKEVEAKAPPPPPNDTPSRPQRQTRQPAEVRQAQEQREQYEQREAAIKKAAKKAPAKKAKETPKRNTNTTTPQKKAAASSSSSSNPMNRTKMNNFSSGSLVWAKWEKYPHFPSEIYDMNDNDDADDIPVNVIRAKPRSKFQCLLVRFFDAKRTWAWVPTHNLMSLGWDDVDQQYLDRSLFKNTKTYDGVRLAYRRAMAALN